jgi:hypothetical protein
MTTDLKTLFQKIKIDAQTADVSYVYYNKKTGEIHKISPRKEDSNYEIVEISQKKVKKLLTGEKKTSDYKVFYDITDKSVTLKNINESNIINSYDKILYKIPKEDLNDSDLTIEQDFLIKTWKIAIGKETIQFLKSNNLSLHDKILLSITKKDDPNILYRTIYVDLGKMIETPVTIPFRFNFEFEQREVSIYTNKYLKSYSYKIIK